MPPTTLPKRVTGTATLILRVKTETRRGWREVEYRVQFLAAAFGASPAFRLFKGPTDFQDVHLSETGAVCTCADFLYRRDGKDERGCRHICGLRAVGLLPPLRSEE